MLTLLLDKGASQAAQGRREPCLPLPPNRPGCLYITNSPILSWGMGFSFFFMTFK